VSNLKKVMIWRLISIVITMVITWVWTEDLLAASGLTILLQGVLLVAHWIFEGWWVNVTVDKLLGPSKKRPDGLLEWSDDEKKWRPGDW
jgi:uncharacterized membrane protein